nr:cancer/testis antigen 55-like [Microcebus murinus]
MFRLLNPVLAFFRKRADHAEEECMQQQGLPQDDIELKTVQGAMTNFFCDYGLINESIYFSDVVTGNVPLIVRQKFTAVVEDNKTSHGLDAVKAQKIFIATGSKCTCPTSPTASRVTKT